MGAATTCSGWSQPIVVPHSQNPSSSSSSSSSQTLASAVSSTKRCRLYLHRHHRVVFSDTTFRSISPSFERTKSRPNTVIVRACLDSFSDEEYPNKFQLTDVNKTNQGLDGVSEESSSLQIRIQLRHGLAEPDWSETDVTEGESNSPFSLGMIQRTLQWQECCSVKKAFSSMVFIIQELHSYTLQLRELLFTQDLQGVLVRVHNELHASFVWLFQRVFSHTPTLMLYVMILLANFTVHSMGSDAASLPPAAYAATAESLLIAEIQDQTNQNFAASSPVKTFSVSSPSAGGNKGGGGKVSPVASGTGDGWLDSSDQLTTLVPDGASQLSSPAGNTESASGQETIEEELSLWNSIVNEAWKMEASVDHETMQRFISPIQANVEPDDDYAADYSRTELLYQTELSRHPDNPLLLTNYAQFLWLVIRDYGRAEEYFKRAIGVKPADAEAYNKYGSFLWRVRNDLWAAEESFLEAIDADPTNAYYAANYAHFLWSTGGEDTCFPLENPQDV